MSFPIVEKLSGVTDGFNTVFETSRSYAAGSVRVFANGIVGEGSLSDGWKELGNKRILMNKPPRSGDVIQAYYIVQ